jgi:hypothetical protein
MYGSHAVASFHNASMALLSGVQQVYAWHVHGPQLEVGRRKLFLLRTCFGEASQRNQDAYTCQFHAAGGTRPVNT